MEQKPVPRPRLFLLEGISLILGPKSNNERFFVRFNSLLIRGEDQGQSVTISKIFQTSGNRLALQQSAEGLLHSSDCSVILF
mgnify:CR=1 FL=1